MEIWPNFLIVGAHKSGTSSLYNYLVQNPKIFMPYSKEPSYFSTFPGTTPFDKVKCSTEEYLELFKNVKEETAIGEASTPYLADPTSAKKIHDKIPNVKIIMMLRNPVEIAYSQYLSSKLKWEKNPPSFFEKINLDLENYDESNPDPQNVLIWGFFSKQVKRYFDLFNRDQILILIHEEIFPKNIQLGIKKILNFIDISELHEFEQKRFNEYFTPRKEIRGLLTNPIVKRIAYALPEKPRISIYEKIRAKDKIKPKMDEKSRIFLNNLYKDDIKKLEELLGKKLPW